MPRSAMATPTEAEHDVLPRGLERPPAAVVADQERGGDGGGLDGDPQHAEVVGEHGQGHGAQEQRHQGGVQPVRSAGVVRGSRARPRSR